MKLSEIKTQKQSIRESANELKGCSQSELMQRLEREISRQKESGEFDVNALRGAVERIKTYLPTETYQNMLEIIGRFE